MKRDLYQEITDTILRQMETVGTAWVKPWAAGDHFSAATGKPYRGINVMLLNMAAAGHGFGSKQWATYRRWSELGGQVRKGEKGTTIVLWKKHEKKVTKDDGTEGVETFPVIRSFVVFNADQVDGADVAEPAVRTEPERNRAAEDVIRATGARIKFAGDRAFYSPAADVIQCPAPQHFTGTPTQSREEALYNTLFHELGHWTGHKSRLDRQMKGFFGSPEYAFEELVAELTAAFVCGHIGVSAEPREDHARYLNSWIRALQDNKRAIFKAASLAQAAADFIVRTAEPVAEPAQHPETPAAPEPETVPAPIAARETITDAQRLQAIADATTEPPRAERCYRSLTGFLNSVRKGMWPVPVYVGRFADGSTARMSFWSEKGKPLDFQRGRRLVAGSKGQVPIHGWVEVGGAFAGDDPALPGNTETPIAA